MHCSFSRNWPLCGGRFTSSDRSHLLPHLLECIDMMIENEVLRGTLIVLMCLRCTGLSRSSLCALLSNLSRWPPLRRWRRRLAMVGHQCFVGLLH